MESPPEKVPMDLDAYARRSQQGPCFVCAIVAGRLDHAHHMVYEDDHAIAFLARYPTLWGYTLVAPRRHAEAVVADFTADEYLRLQGVVHRVGRAVARVVPTERLYVMSLGSQQGNAHVHWHLAPLPPGVPYREQQFHACMAEFGVLDPTEDEQADLAARIRRELGHSTRY